MGPSRTQTRCRFICLADGRAVVLGALLHGSSASFTRAQEGASFARGGTAFCAAP
jgi:hypothetical protein